MTGASGPARGHSGAITFVCGTPHGGALDSTVSLAHEAMRQGRAVHVIVSRDDPYRTRPRTTSALVKLEQAWAPLGRQAWRVHDRVASRTRTALLHGVTIERSSNVVGSAARLAASVIVANSLRGLDLRRLMHVGAASSTAIVWYLREATALSLIDIGRHADVLVANSRPLAAEVQRRSGRPCQYVPSVIDRSGLQVPGERRVVLLVNPIASHGLEVALDLAALRPDRSFVLQESWPLGRSAVADLERRIRDLPNVELRARTDRASLYRDARVLLAPHDPQAMDLSRPRVALESQLLGIPLLGTDIPGLAAAAASPDLLLAPGSAAPAWSDAIDRIDAEYAEYSSRAARFADAELPDAQEVWQQFVAACEPVIDR
jgi:glycosyltransferase involved in cell wall biosynthesis